MKQLNDSPWEDSEALVADRIVLERGIFCILVINIVISLVAENRVCFPAAGATVTTDKDVITVQGGPKHGPDVIEHLLLLSIIFVDPVELVLLTYCAGRGVNTGISYGLWYR